jgi:hypothetical protein
VEQLPFEQIVSPAGVVLAGALTRQIIEVLKGTILPWLDRDNERKGVVIVAGLIYLGWLIAYGQDLATDGWTALFSVLAVSGTAIGANEAVDAVKGQVTKNVVATIRERPELVGATPNDGGFVGSARDDVVDGVTDGPDLDLLVADGASEHRLEGAVADPAMSRG